MILLLTGFAITVVSLLIGYNLGKNQTVVSTDVKKQIDKIFNRVVPNSEVGVIPRPTVVDNFYRDNPRIAKEHEVMNDTFKNLQ